MEKRTLVMMIKQMVVGGAETQIINILNAIDRDRYDVHLCLFAETCVYRDELEQLNVPVTVIKKGIKLDFIHLMRLTAWLRHLRPHIVNTWITEANSVGTVAAALSRVPVRIGCVLNVNFWKTRLRLFYDQHAMGCCHSVVTNATQINEFLVNRMHLSPSKLKIIYNGIDPQRFRLAPAEAAEARSRIRREFGLAEDDVVFINVAGLRVLKNHRQYLETIARLAEQHNFKFLIVGDGALLDPVRERAACLNLQNIVRFAGLRRDIPQMLAAADVFVLPSIIEGVPHVVLEAMAAGLPVVATNVGGIPDALEHEKTGILVPFGDDTALCDAIIRLGTDPVERERLGQPGFDCVEERFTTEKMVRSFIDLYDGLAERYVR